MALQDHFSRQSAEYSKFRPHYPDSLFKYLAGVSPSHEVAWDCATGNGQAAVALASFFDHVIATDGSEKQIHNAEQNPRIEYRVATAEKCGLPPDSTDLITVAQALHWFDLDCFYREAERVLKPDGILAVWCYDLLEIEPEIDMIVHRFYDKIVGKYWAFERKIVEQRYQTIAFPFAEMEPPTFAMRARWSMEHLIGYLQTWSATQTFIVANGSDPIDLIRADLSEAWREPNRVRPVNWPLSLRVGRTAIKQ
ncbi:MAG: hypothetical protein QOG67_2139 [Verrucomicrobiota bacterium]|jgi:SAM-dependent methyltransferase